MKIIITMSGHSKRFTDLGFPHKLFMNVMGRPAIELCLSIFDSVPDQDKYIIKRHDLDLGSYCDGMNVASIDGNTSGPIASILDADLQIDDDEPVIISYSDFWMKFNPHMFAFLCKITNADGAIVSHSGYHPHRLYNSSFCYLRTDGSKVLEVKEKAPFTDDPMLEPASSGIYYFRSFRMMNEYFHSLIEQDIRVNGEFYVTLPYNLMIEDGLNVIHVPVQNYMCLGTPQDVQLVNYTYNHWRIDD